MEDARNNGNFKCRKEKDGVQQQERETVSDKVAKQVIEKCVGKLNENMGDVLRVLIQAPKKKGKRSKKFRRHGLPGPVLQSRRVVDSHHKRAPPENKLRVRASDHSR